LLDSLSTQCHGDNIRATLTVKPHQAKFRAKLFAHAEIIKEVVQQNGDWLIDLNIPNRFGYLLKEMDEH
jgi:hypothetical protein